MPLSEIDTYTHRHTRLSLASCLPRDYCSGVKQQPGRLSVVLRRRRKPSRQRSGQSGSGCSIWLSSSLDDGDEVGEQASGFRVPGLRALKSPPSRRRHRVGCWCVKTRLVTVQVPSNPGPSLRSSADADIGEYTRSAAAADTNTEAASQATTPNPKTVALPPRLQFFLCSLAPAHSPADSLRRIQICGLSRLADFSTQLLVVFSVTGPWH